MALLLSKVVLRRVWVTDDGGLSVPPFTQHYLYDSTFDDDTRVDVLVEGPWEAPFATNGEWDSFWTTYAHPAYAAVGVTTPPATPFELFP